MSEVKDSGEIVRAERGRAQRELAPKKERAAQFLASEMSHRQVALALGLTEGRVSQLASEKDVINRVAELVSAANEETRKRDRSYRVLESSIIDQVHNNLEMASFSEQVRALQVVSDIRVETDKSTSVKKAGNAGGGPGVHLNLVLSPSVTGLVHTTNERNEIITVDEKPMISMPSASVEQIMQQELVKDDE